MQYKDVYVYVMQFEYIFQYLIAWDGQVVQDRVTLKPKLLRRILYRLGLAPAYTADQVQEGEEIILSGALATIDHLKANAPAMRKRIRAAQRKKEKSANSKCTWQALFGKGDDRYYSCIVHDKIIEMEDGADPKHD